MGQEPEELRAELAAKRDDLTYDLEAIGDRVSPGRVIERRQAAVRMRFGDMRERMMGSKDYAVEHMQHGAHGATSAVSGTAERIGEAAKQRTEGAPLAVGSTAMLARTRPRLHAVFRAQYSQEGRELARCVPRASLAA